MFFQILGAIAEFEHALMSERTMDGLAAARGRTGGQILKHREERGRDASAAGRTVATRKGPWRGGRPVGGGAAERS
ncbi:DNA invertase Pin-like site-specific DNA recombinase [Streptacidiphilus sp. MAP12-20]